MELFREDGCMTDAGFRAMMDGQLDELGRLEAAEHLSYCDQCMDRYTALLTADALEKPPKSVQGAVMGTIWARLMQNTYGRAAVAGVAAVLALTLWRSGALQQIIQYGAGRETVLETDQSQLWEPGRNDPAPENTPQYHTIEEMKTICTCGRKATCNCRKVNGEFVFEGEQVAIDLENDVQYVSMCPQCYFKARRAFYAKRNAQ